MFHEQSEGWEESMKGELWKRVLAELQGRKGGTRKGEARKRSEGIPNGRKQHVQRVCNGIATLMGIAETGSRGATWRHHLRG